LKKPLVDAESAIGEVEDFREEPVEPFPDDDPAAALDGIMDDDELLNAFSLEAIANVGAMPHFSQPVPVQDSPMVNAPSPVPDSPAAAQVEPPPPTKPPPWWSPSKPMRIAVVPSTRNITSVTHAYRFDLEEHPLALRRSFPSTFSRVNYMINHASAAHRTRVFAAIERGV
jgi:hypothetical protein